MAETAGAVSGRSSSQPIAGSRLTQRATVDVGGEGGAKLFLHQGLATSFPKAGKQCNSLGQG